MKRYLYVLSFLLIGIFGYSQNISGTWNGALQISGQELPLVFHIENEAGLLVTTMDSPLQNAFGLKVEKTSFEESILSLNISAINASYKGTLKEGQEIIEGEFTQNGMNFKLDLTREPVTESKEPQKIEPDPSFTEEEVKFKNNQIELAGTLTYPKTGSNFPAVILIHGSGPNNRNQELFGHQMFKDIASDLTKSGIAVLRYDKRGIGQSTGSFEKAILKDFASDVAAALAFLKSHSKIDSTKIGLLGHSEGGMIAPMVATKHPEISFVILLAGPGVSGADVLLLQQKLISSSMGLSEEYIQDNYIVNKEAYTLIEEHQQAPDLKEILENHFEKAIEQHPILLELSGIKKEDYLKEATHSYMNPWMQSFLVYNPSADLQKLKMPVLALNGSKDLQVDANQNLKAIEKALQKGGNTAYQIKEIEGVNHLFQEADTGSPLEYGQIKQSISPQVLKIIKNWIHQQL